MNTGLKRSNEELVLLYRESRNERYLQELINQNTGLINILIRGYVNSIPNAEYEDLVSESYIPMLRAIDDFDASMGLTFSNLLKVYVRQHLNRLYNEATRKKRYTGSTPVSYESLVEINKEGGDVTDRDFTIECKEISSYEFLELLASLHLNEKEQVAVNILMEGGTKGEVAKALKCTPATANYYFKSIRKKFVFAGVTL
jgi:DNA-directed RNA polymerase specialized sigma24 family protein